MHALLERGVFVRKPGEPPINGFIRVTVGTAAERERCSIEAFCRCARRVYANA